VDAKAAADKTAAGSTAVAAAVLMAAAKTAAVDKTAVDKTAVGGVAVRIESFANIHSASGCDVADDGGRRSGGCGRVPAAAGFGPPAGRLPDHADPDVLSRG